MLTEFNDWGGAVKRDDDNGPEVVEKTGASRRNRSASAGGTPSPNLSGPEAGWVTKQPQSIAWVRPYLRAG